MVTGSNGAGAGPWPGCVHFKFPANPASKLPTTCKPGLCPAQLRSAWQISCCAISVDAHEPKQACFTVIRSTSQEKHKARKNNRDALQLMYRALWGNASLYQ